MTLTAAKAKALSKPGMHNDGRGLYLRVAKGGSKGWILRIAIDRRRRDIGLGGYPAVSLAKARQIADAHRLAVAEGRDPLAEKHREKMPTFAEAAAKVHEANLTDQWINTLRTYAFPVFGATRVDRIERRDVLAALTPIWSARPETARRVRQRIRTVLRWCEAHDYCTGNAAGEALDGALPAMTRLKAHHRALPYREVAAALATVEASGASLAAKLCLRFLILAAARSGEARGATWGEIDLDAREWRVPAERMKGGVEHRVPLSDAALDVLHEAAALRNESGLIFPSPRKRGRPLSDMSLTVALRRAELADRATIHGFRSAFRTWASERIDWRPTHFHNNRGAGPVELRFCQQKCSHHHRFDLNWEYSPGKVRKGGLPIAVPLAPDPPDFKSLLETIASELRIENVISTAAPNWQMRLL